jgi:protocatechuate 3,4-dioxygenase beta subunit
VKARVLALAAVMVAAAAVALVVLARSGDDAASSRASPASGASPRVASPPGGSPRGTGRVAARPPALSAPEGLLSIAGASAVVRGTVRDLQGAPISGARIITRYGRVQTDRAGAFEIRLPTGKSTMKLEADGFASAERWVLAPSDVELVLVRESTIAGHVVDATGAPVAGARVTFDHERTVVESAADGAFAFSRLPAAVYLLTATTPDGFATTFELQLGVGQRIEGVVLRLVPAHQITLLGGAECEIQINQWGLQVGSRWKAGADLRIDGVPAGRYLISGRCGDEGLFRQVIDVADNRAFVLERGPAATGTVRGRVVAPGRPDARLKVYVTPAAREAIVEPDGTYQLAVPPGEYTLRAGERGPESDLVKVSVAANATVERTITLPPAPEGRLLVQVVDRAGKPVPYARVELAGPTSERVNTNRDGVETTRVAPGTYTARANGGTAQVVVAPGVERTVRIVTAVDSVVRGVVVDERGAPVAGAFVAFDTDATAAITDTSGAFALRGGSPNWYVALVAYRPGEATRATGYGAPDTIAKLVLGGSSSISGRVTRADGSVPDRFEIILRSVGNHETRTFFQTGGAFLRTGLTAGPYKLGASINGVAVWTDLVLEPGERRANLQLVLPPVAAIAGTVVDAATGDAIAGVTINARCDRAGEPLAFVHADQLSGPDGRFEIRELPPGPCVLGVKPPAGWLPANKEVMVPGELGELRLARARN